MRRRAGGFDEARAGFVNTHDSAWMPAQVRGGQVGLRPVGWGHGGCEEEKAGEYRWQRAGSGPQAAGAQGFWGGDAAETAGSRLDSHEIRGLCFLYAVLRGCAFLPGSAGGLREQDVGYVV